MKVLERMGWFQNNSTGRHRVYAHHNKQGYVSVPDHKELQTGTLRNIIKQAGVSVEDFYKVAEEV